MTVNRRNFLCLMAAPVIVNIDRLMPLSLRANGYRHLYDHPLKAIDYNFYRNEAIISYHGVPIISTVKFSDVASIVELTRRVVSNIHAYYDNPGLNGSTCYDARDRYAKRQIQKGLQLPAVKRYALKPGSLGRQSEIYHFSDINLALDDPNFSYIGLEPWEKVRPPYDR